MNKILKRYVDIALSDVEVLKLVNGRANIILYPDLYKYEHIDEILEPFGSCFLLYEAKPNYGHWCCLNKLDENTIEYFDPYGKFVDDTLYNIPMNFRKISNQYYPHLTWLLYNSGYNIDYNEYPFQKHEKDIKTCGRWCAMRIICKFMKLNTFAKYFYNKNGDKFVTLLTMYINK